MLTSESTIFSTHNNIQSNNEVTKICYSVRIDYILRFSNQVVVVIDENSTDNHHFSSDYLSKIPEHHNITYIKLSAQFDDIQVRCRIIEQLYSNELFDPEISLASNIVDLVKKNNQPTTIVLENTEHLSLQIILELTQLVTLAKSNNLIINVVLFGKPLVGMKIVENKKLFNNKLALLSGQTGQILAANAIIFQQTPNLFHRLKTKKNFYFIAALLVVLYIVVDFAVYQENDATPVFEKQKIANSNSNSNKENIFVVNQSAPKKVSSTKSVVELAKPQEIYRSLMAADDIIDIEKDIDLTINKKKPIVVEEEKSLIVTQQVTEAIVNDKLLPIAVTGNTNKTNHIQGVDHQYYLTKQAGFVIQIASLKNSNFPDTFQESLNKIDYHLYQRVSNNILLTVVTSKVFPTKEQAKSALKTLPNELLTRQPWLKSLEKIKSEITGAL